MAEGNVEIVERIYDGWGEGRFGSSVDAFDRHVLFVINKGFPDPGAYLGEAGIAGYMRGFLESWTRITIEAEELVPAGDTIIARIVQRGVGDASGAETEFRYFQLWTFRGDRVIRLENMRERDEAFAAAGLAT